MTETSLGELIASARKRQGPGYTQERLARDTGYSTVMISKIEKDHRLPAGDKLPLFAECLGLDLEELRDRSSRAARASSSSGEKLGEAILLAKANFTRAKVLKADAERLQTQSKQSANRLARSNAAFREEVFAPFVQTISTFDQLPDDLILPGSTRRDPEHSTFAGLLEDVQVGTAATLGGALALGAITEGIGTGISEAAAAATYASVAAAATASTRVAIASLSGPVLRTATVGWFAGEGLTAAGLGVAGGTAVLSGIVALPFIALATSAILASGGRVLAKQLQIDEELNLAEAALRTNEALVTKFVARSTKIALILDRCCEAAHNHFDVINEGLGATEAPKPNDRVDWTSLTQDVDASIRRLAVITGACLTVTALPLINLKPERAEDAAGEHDNTADPQLESVDEVEDDFIDFAIQEVSRQVSW